MANPEHVNAVLQGARSLAEWREHHPAVRLDLSGANLRRSDFAHANLNGADLRDSNLEWADFRWADVIESDLSGALLSRADLHKADLAGARLAMANLSDANLEDANCRGVDFDSAVFLHTRLLNTDLAGAKGLDSAAHEGPSLLDPETISKSGHLPRKFLLGCGLSNRTIGAAYQGDAEALAKGIGAGGDYYSCFISYSSQDQTFVDRLWADLQERGVRCWYDRKDMKIGQRIHEAVYGAIRQREKLLLVLSVHSVQSVWVGNEVGHALGEENDRGDVVVFPIRIDEAVMGTDAPWARMIRNTRHIGDFRDWSIETQYHASLERLVQDLTKPYTDGVV